MTDSKITIDQFYDFKLSQISQTYLGADACCRCGCRGEYTATSYHNSPRSEVNDSLVETRLERAKRLIRKGNKYEIGSNNINVSTGNNRALTLYFDEIK
jgi:hypothetical protein